MGGRRKQLFRPRFPTDYLHIYSLLGGTSETLHKDIEQARRMIRLRIKIDVWSQGLHESIRQNSRQVLEDTYVRFPPRRVWLYLKLARAMFAWREHEDCLDEQSPRKPASASPPLMWVNGPEDDLARASKTIQPGRIGRLMHDAVMREMQIKALQRMASSCLLSYNKMFDVNAHTYMYMYLLLAVVILLLACFLSSTLTSSQLF
ncbi:hypothetical protein QBC46DRAFT_426139 [Diplogelasinospora grovesii]|uniref:Uncharacterized protein n=1 Tax=Diplogelasinospora grovesii TaxID=303347 RepID=A0AAN6MYP8_9PEZI|nr:hypothetical protein QBC46DRAFT_426139 [Diplogelasinospora grovesii]